MSGEQPQPQQNLHSVVLITCPNEEVSKAIAHRLVEKQLAACVNIVPKITSVYRWEGKVNEDSEYLLIAKTRNALISDLSQEVKQNHPYSVPEVIALDIKAGHQPYLDWITQSTPKKKQ